MGRLIKGILIGAVAGAVIGVLYAPRKGSKTRKKLKRKGAEIKDALSNIENKVSSQYESIKEDTGELLDQQRERLQDTD